MGKLPPLVGSPTPEQIEHANRMFAVEREFLIFTGKPCPEWLSPWVEHVTGDASPEVTEELWHYAFEHFKDKLGTLAGMEQPAYSHFDYDHIRQEFTSEEAFQRTANRLSVLKLVEELTPQLKSWLFLRLAAEQKI